jgi:DNA-binding PucR family transcriptional regulator
VAAAHAALGAATRHIWVATGTWSEGCAGLRRTHEDALQARRVARDGERAPGTLTPYGEVAIASLLGSDLHRARRFVQETLGPLAASDESATRLRETLAAFLEGGSSHVAAARRLHVHQNTVAYRVRRAEELLSAPVADVRLELEIALALASALGVAVLGRGST